MIFPNDMKAPFCSLLFLWYCRTFEFWTLANKYFLRFFHICTLKKNGTRGNRIKFFCNCFGMCGTAAWLLFDPGAFWMVSSTALWG